MEQSENSYDVTPDENQSNPSPAGAMAVEMCVENDDIGPNADLITREYMVELQGSLLQMQSQGGLSEWTPYDGCEKRLFQSHRHGGNDNVRAETRGGDIQNAVLHSMYIKEVQSDFPCPLGLTISGVKGNRFTANGERYADIVLPNTHSDKKRCVCVASPYINSAYLSMFPGMTRDKLRSHGVLDVPDEPYKFVDHRHPVVAMMKENNESLQMDIGDCEVIDGRWIKVGTNAYEKCMQSLDKELVSNLPLINLSKFSVKVDRTGGLDWNSTEGLRDVSHKKDGTTKLLNKSNNMRALLEIRYRFM